MATIGPQQLRAAERAAFLNNLLGMRPITLDFAKDEVVTMAHAPTLRPTLATDIVTRLMGSASQGEQLNQYLQSQGQSPMPSDVAEAIAEDHEVAIDQWDMPTPQVLVQLLRQAPQAEVRKLLRELRIKVLVSLPLGRSAGRTPVTDRVTVELFSSSQQAALTLRVIDSKITTCEEAVSARG